MREKIARFLTLVPAMLSTGMAFSHALQLDHRASDHGGAAAAPCLAPPGWRNLEPAGAGCQRRSASVLMRANTRNRG